MAIADSILENLDRETLAELLASYVYLKPKGKANFGGLVKYAVSRRFRESATVAMSVTPAIIAGIIADKDFRSAVFSYAGSWVTGRQEQEDAAEEG